MVTTAVASAWDEIEIIGWLYQFYISEKKDQVIGNVVASEDIPAATQLFTPNWIVKYMVQNSLGAKWMATYPHSQLKEQMEYYIEPRPRAGGVHLGDCLRDDGPSPCNAGAELRDGPEFSIPCPRSAVYSKHAVPWTRCGKLLRRLPGRNAIMRFRSKAGPKRNVLDSGRGRPVRRILVHAMRGLAQPDRPTSLDRGSSATK